MGPQEDYIETVLTCEGDFYDPDFHSKLQTFSQRLQTLLLKGGGSQLILKKVEPWNSVRVTFNIPREAALRLRQLAEQGHATLRDLGILAVQIDGDRMISLTIAGKNNERTELVFQMPSATPAQPHGSLFDMNSSDEMSLSGPSNVEATRKNIAQYLRDQGGHGPNLFESLFGQQPSSEFKSPHLIGPLREGGPGRPGSLATFGSPCRSPSHSLSGTVASSLAPLGLPSPAYSHSQGLPSPGGVPGPVSPGYPTPPPSQPPLPGSPLGRSSVFPAASTSPLNNMQRLLPNKDITSASPLLVNLLQTDPAAAHLNSLLHQKMPPPGDAALPTAKRKRRPRKNKDISPKGKPGLAESGNGLAAMFGLGGDCLSNGPHPGQQNSGDSSSLPAALQARLGLPGALDTGQLPGNRPTDSVLGGGLSPVRSVHSSPEKIINPYTGQLEPVDNTSDRDSDVVVPRNESTESLNSLDVPTQLHPPPNPLVALQNRLAACDGNSGQLLNKSSPQLDKANSMNSSRIPFSQPGRLSPGASQASLISGLGQQSPCVSEADLPSDRVSPASLKARLSPGSSQPCNLPISPARQAMSRVSADFMPLPSLSSGEGLAHADGIACPSFPSDHFMNARSHQVMSTIRGLPPGMRAAHPRLPPPYRYPSSSGASQQHHVIPPHSAPATANLLSSGGPPASALPMAMGLRLGGPHRPQNSTSSRLPGLIDTLPHSTSIVESVAAKLTNVMSGTPGRGQYVGVRKGSWDGLDVKAEPGCNPLTTTGMQPNSPLTNNGHTDSSSQKGSIQDAKPVNHNSTHANDMDMDSSAQSKPDSVCKSELHATHVIHSTECNDKVLPAVESKNDKCVTIKTESIKSEDPADLCETKSKDKERTISRFGSAGDTPASVAFKLEPGSVPSPVVSSSALSAAAMHNDLHSGLVRGSNGASTGEASPMSSDNASSASQPRADQSPLQNNLAHTLNNDSESSHSDDNPSSRNASGLVPLGQAVLKDASHGVDAKDTEHKNIITVGYALSRDNNTTVTKDILGDKVLKSLGNLPYLTKPNKDKDYMPGVKGVPLAPELIGQGKLVKSPIILKEVDTRTQEVQERCQEEDERARTHAYLSLTKCFSLPPHTLPHADSCPPLLERTLAMSKELALKSTVVAGLPSHNNHLMTGAKALWSSNCSLATSLRGQSGLSNEASSSAPGEVLENHCGHVGNAICSVAPQTFLAAGPPASMQQPSKSLPVSPRARMVSPRCSQFSSTAPPSPSGEASSGRRSAPIPGIHSLSTGSPLAQQVRSYTPALGLMEALSRAQVSSGGVAGWVSPPRAALNNPRVLLHPADTSPTSQLSQHSNQSKLRGIDTQSALVSETSTGPLITLAASVTTASTTTLPVCGRPPYSQAAETPPTAGSEGSVAKQPSLCLNTAQKSPGQPRHSSASVPIYHKPSANSQPAVCLQSLAHQLADSQPSANSLHNTAVSAASSPLTTCRLVTGLPIPKALGVWSDIPAYSSSGCSPTAQVNAQLTVSAPTDMQQYSVSTAVCNSTTSICSSSPCMTKPPSSAVVESAGLRSPGVARPPALPRAGTLRSPPPVQPRAVSLSSPPSSSGSMTCGLPQLVPAPSAASLTAVQPTWSCTIASPSIGTVHTALQPCLMDNNIIVKAEVASEISSSRHVSATVVSSTAPLSSGASTLLPSSISASVHDRSCVASKGVSILQPMYERDADVEAELNMIAKLEGKATKETGHRGLDTTMMTLIPHKGSRSTFTVAQLLDDSKAKKNTPNMKHSRMFTVNAKDSNSVLPTTCVKTAKSASVKSANTSAGLRSQTISACTDFHRNSSAHLSSLMQKSIQSQSSLLNAAPHPITAPGFHLNLTESVQRVMSAIPCVDALSPPLDPPAVSLPGASPHKDDGSVRSPAAGSKGALLPFPCLTPQASRTPSPKAVRPDSSGPASSPLTSSTGPSPQAVGPTPCTPVTCISEEVRCAAKETAVSQSSPTQQTEVVESRLGITRVKSEERVDSGIETSSTGTPSSSDTSSVTSLHMPEPCIHEEFPLEADPVHCNGPSHASPDHMPDSGQDHALSLAQELLGKTEDNQHEDASPRLARMTRRSSRSSTDSRSGSAESLRSKEETLQGSSRRRLRSDGSDISTETVDSGRGTRCTISADRTSTPSPTPRSTRVSTRSVRKRTSPDLDDSSSVEPAQAITRGSKRKLVLDDEGDKRSRHENTPKEGLRARKITTTPDDLESALDEHNYSGSKRARPTKKDDENPSETSCKKVVTKKVMEKPANSYSTEKSVCVGRARPGKAAVEPRAAEDGTAKRATRSTRSRDPGDAPVGKRRRTSRDHR